VLARNEPLASFRGGWKAARSRIRIDTADAHPFMNIALDFRALPLSGMNRR